MSYPRHQEKKFQTKLGLLGFFSVLKIFYDLNVSYFEVYNTLYIYIEI